MITHSDDWDFFSAFGGPAEKPSPTTARGSGVRDDTAPSYRMHDNFVAEISGQRSLVTRLSRFFERTCDERPSATALECDGDSVSYADLDQRANRLANLLITLGASAGVRVSLLMHRS